jgi:LPS O-antigen subunit length determinant protein (WzzB/FepE family)
MKINKSLIKGDDIDLLEFLRKIYKEKVLLVSVSLLFMVIGYVYGFLQPKIYKTTVLLREAPPYLFHFNLRPSAQPLQFSFNAQPFSLAKDFDKEFKIILSSSEYLSRFIAQNNKTNEFKLNHKNKNIEIKKNLKEKVKIILGQEKDSSFQYTVTYPEHLAVDQFLNDFISFAKEETEVLFKKQREHLINNEIRKYKDNLEIAKKINLENPTQYGYYSYDLHEDSALFNRGTKVLTYQIADLNLMLSESNTLKLHYNPILEKESSPTLISKSPLVLGAIFFLLGLFLSLLLIFIRFLLKNQH